MHIYMILTIYKGISEVKYIKREEEYRRITEYILMKSKAKQI